MLIAGISLFALASLACAAAPSLGVLLAGRLLQGVGAAMLMPNSLAVLGSSFSGEEKGHAVGIWAATSAMMGAIGPVLGGWLIDLGSWRAIFLINLPLAAAAIILARVYIRDDPDSNDEPLDWTGSALATLGLGGLTWALTIGSGRAGWTPLAIFAAILALIMLALFLIVEGWRGNHAMMPLALFASRSFIGLTLLTFLLYGALAALLVLIPYVLIEAAGYSGTGAGAALLPLPVVLSLTSPMMGRLAGRLGLASAADLGFVNRRPRLPAGRQV
jgi:MFS family permease